MKSQTPTATFLCFFIIASSAVAEQPPVLPYGASAISNGYSLNPFKKSAQDTTATFRHLDLEVDLLRGLGWKPEDADLRLASNAPMFVSRDPPKLSLTSATAYAVTYPPVAAPVTAPMPTVAHQPLVIEALPGSTMWFIDRLTLGKSLWVGNDTALEKAYDGKMLFFRVF
jgi:hypothetical protein